MPVTVLVTGGAGFIGAYVVRALLAADHPVVVFDRSPADNALDLVPRGDGSPADVVAGDICDAVLLRQLCDRHDVDRIVHLASPLTKDVDEATTSGLRDICVGTSTVFDVAAACSIRRVVWTSSVAVFGPSDGYPPGSLANDAPHRPTSLYGRAKSLCEAVAEHATASRGIDTVGLRLSVVYGAGRLRGYMSYASHLIREVALGGPVSIEPGRQRLHWQYVDEVASAVTHVLEHPAPGGGRTFNCPGVTHTYGEVGEVLRRLRPDVDIAIGDDSDPPLAGVVDDYDASALDREFGYTPKWTFEDGVEATLETYERIVAEDPAAARR
jgi:nucleoside-diphosphate-sugar epimerase